MELCKRSVYCGQVAKNFMDKEKAYTRFIDHMQSFLIGLPESEVLMPLLEARLTPEEADFLADLPFLPFTIEQLAEKFETPVDELSEKLDPLAGRGIVFLLQPIEQGKWS